MTRKVVRKKIDWLPNQHVEVSSRELPVLALEAVLRLRAGVFFLEAVVIQAAMVRRLSAVKSIVAHASCILLER